MSRLVPKRIDELLSPDHYYLGEDDRCHFLREYTSGAGYQHGETNDIISNLKKEMDRRGRSEWKWKGWAIDKCAGELELSIGETKWAKTATIVPMPPSAAVGTPAYDDRLLQILAKALPEADVRQLLVATASREPAHAGSEHRKTPEEHYANLSIDEDLVDPAPSAIGIFDDLIVTGSQFVAAKRLLSERFPGVPILGLFIARRALPNPFEDLAETE